MKKKVPAELFYILAEIFVSAAIALLDKAGFGMTTIASPNYTIFKEVEAFWPGATLGIVSYLIEGVLIIAMCLIIRKFRFVYLFSFVTAVITGYTIDAFIVLLKPVPSDVMAIRIICFGVGLCCTAFGVSCILHTYLAPEAYELILKEIPRKFGLDVGRFKTAYDVSCVAASIVLSFIFFGFGQFMGVGIGTVICAFCNGTLISKFNSVIDRHVTVVDLLPLRPFFEGKESHLKK